MNEMRGLKNAIRSLLSAQRLGVLCTSGEAGSHASLVAFAARRDLTQLSFVTSRSTRKFANLCVDPRVALLVDNRSNREEDFHNAVAVTAKGVAEEATGAGRSRLLKRYLVRHPHLTEFARAPTCALLRVSVDSYSLVRRFQEVTDLQIKRCEPSSR